MRLLLTPEPAEYREEVEAVPLSRLGTADGQVSDMMLGTAAQ